MYLIPWFVYQWCANYNIILYEAKIDIFRLKSCTLGVASISSLLYVIISQLNIDDFLMIVCRLNKINSKCLIKYTWNVPLIEYTFITT